VTGFPKPLRGTALLARRKRRADQVKAEKREMHAALVRDKMQCRLGKLCEFAYRHKVLPVDPCHQVHRGMGGNPKLDRTTRQTVIALCRPAHGQWDAGIIEFDPLTDVGFDGPVAFYRKHPESGKMLQIGAEAGARVAH